MIVLCIVLGAFAAVLLMRRRKSRRADIRSGIVAERPQFTVSPPVITLVRKEDHRW